MDAPYHSNQVSRAQRNMIQDSREGTFQDSGPWDRTGVGLRAIVPLWTRNRLIITSVFSLIFGCSVAWIFVSPHTYEAVVKIFVKRARMEELGADRDASTAGPADVSESDIRSEIEILRSRPLLERVVEECHLASRSPRLGPTNEFAVALAVRRLEQNLRITPVTKTNIVAVSYISKNPTQAADILKTLTALYLEKHTALHRSHETSQFFGDQATRYRADLAVAQQKLSDFQQLHEASLLDERKELNLKRIAELEAVLEQTNADVQDATHRTELLSAEKDSLPPMIQSQSRTARNELLLEKLKSDLMDLENKRTELLTKFDPSYRLVTEVDQQIRDTREAIVREEAPGVVDRTDALNPLRESTETDLFRTRSQLVGLLARRQSLIRDIESSRAKQKAMEQLTAEYNDLQRGKTITEANYMLYQKKTEEAHIADALDQHKFLNVSILEEASPPALPRDKHSGFILLLGLILATTCAFVAGSVAESLHPLIRSPGEASIQTNLPILAELSGGKILSSINYEEDMTVLDTDQVSDAGAEPSEAKIADPLVTNVPLPTKPTQS